MRRFLNDEYYEYVRVNTVDPFYLNYGDEWKDFRILFCGEDDEQKNNTASNINITLTPVKKVDGIWIKLDEYDSYQSAIVINNNEDSNYLTPKLMLENGDGNPKFYCGLVFNDVYENNFEDYLRETYQITVDENFKIKYGFVIGDKNNPYKYTEHVFDYAETGTSFELDEFVFDSWNDYVEGMYAQVYVILQKHDEDILVLISNQVYITQEEFKYFMRMPEGEILENGIREIRKVDLDSLDMDINKYNVVNVIENKIVSVERPSDYKANIIKPVFIKVQDADSIRLHRSVTENIVINLDAYKNKVKAFILKVGDTNYYEIGRVNSGIIFKVVGSSLPEEDGIYYILNDDGELVTTGKYVIA